MPFGLGALITALGALFSRVMFTKAGAWVTAILVFLGLELATYSFAIEPMRDTIQTKFFGIPVSIRQWMGVLRIDQYVTIIISAYIASVVKKVMLRRRTA